jgi:hypothetical protein
MTERDETRKLKMNISLRLTPLNMLCFLITAMCSISKLVGIISTPWWVIVLPIQFLLGLFALSIVLKTIAGMLE